MLHLGEADAGESCDAPVSGTFNHASFDCTGKRGLEARLTAHGIDYRTARVPLTGQASSFAGTPRATASSCSSRAKRKTPGKARVPVRGA